VLTNGNLVVSGSARAVSGRETVANLNALTGLLRPGDLGGDVSHLNLHKTFAIPHGGGGPGVGPVVVKEHLAPYLPAGPAGSALPTEEDHDRGFGGAAVMGARFGSAGVMPLAWTYLATLTDADLRRVTLTALAHASYLSQALADVFPTLYTHRGHVAHECVLDLRALTAATVAGLAIVDMVKGVDRGVELREAKVVAKSGGRSGDWVRGDRGDRGDVA